MTPDVNNLRVAAFKAVLDLLATRPKWELLVIAFLFATVVKVLTDFIGNASMSVPVVKKYAKVVGFKSQAQQHREILAKLDELLKDKNDRL